MPTPELWLKAEDYQGNGPWIDRVASKYAAMPGGNQSAAIARAWPTNDVGMFVPGTDSGARGTVPTNAVLVPTDLDVIVRCRLYDLTPPAQLQLVNKLTGNVGYYVAIQTSGTPVLVFGDGALSVIQVGTAIAAAGAQVGKWFWLRFTADASAGAGEHFINLSESDVEPTSWTSIGTDTDIVETVGDSTNVFVMGDADGGPHWISRVILKASIGGATIFDADFGAQPLGTTEFTDDGGSALTVTVAQQTGGGDPLFFPRHGKRFAYSPALASNSITGTIADQDGETERFDFRVETENDHIGTSRFFDEANGVLYFSQSTASLSARVNDTTGTFTPVSTIAVPYSAGEWYQARVVFDLDLADASATFYTRDIGTDLADDAGWVQLGSVVLLGRAFSGQDLATVNGRIFSTGAAGITGSLQRVYCTSGDTPTVFIDCDLNNAAEPYATFVSGGITWTINRSAAGIRLTVIDQPCFLHASDYLLVDDHDDLDLAEADDATWLFRGRFHGSASAQTILDKGKNATSTDAGWALQIRATDEILAAIADGTTLKNDITSTTLTLGQEFVAIGRRDRSGADELAAFLDGGGDSPTTANLAATLANAFELAIGGLNNGGAPVGQFEGELFEVKFWRTALTDDEIQNEVTPGDGGAPLLLLPPMRRVA